MIGLSSGTETLLHAEVGLVDASVDGGSWSLDDAMFKVELAQTPQPGTNSTNTSSSNTSLVDWTADARIHAWATSLDGGYRLEVADAYFGVTDGTTGDVWVEVGPLDAVTQVELDTSLRVLIDVDYDGSALDMTLTAGEKGNTTFAVGESSPLYADSDGYALQPRDYIMVR